MPDPETPALAVGSPFFLDGRRCEITKFDAVRIWYRRETFGGTAARADLTYNPEFQVFHLVGRLHAPVRKSAAGALAKEG